MPEGFKKVTHCLFDMDGLLLNTEHLYTQVFQRILDELNSSEIFTGDFKVTLMGAQSFEVARAVIKRYNLDISVEDFVAKQRSISNELMPKAELLPGVERLLRHLYAKKVPFALATSSSKEMYDLKSVQHGEIFELFDHKVYGSSDPEVVNGKPSPDIFIVAARRFADSPPTADCLVFEDAPNGLKAGLSAGCQVVLVPEDYVTPDLRVGATLVLNSLEDFKPEQFGLPPFDE